MFGNHHRPLTQLLILLCGRHHHSGAEPPPCNHLWCCGPALTVPPWGLVLYSKANHVLGGFSLHANSPPTRLVSLAPYILMSMYTL